MTTHDLYIAEEPPDGDASEWDTGLDRAQLIERVNQAILGNEPGDRLYIVIETRDERVVAQRLEYLRGEIRAERISYGEIDELEDLAEYIEPGDTELLEWAGVPEFPEESDAQ